MPDSPTFDIEYLNHLRNFIKKSSRSSGRSTAALLAMFPTQPPPTPQTDEDMKQALMNGNRRLHDMKKAKA